MSEIEKRLSAVRQKPEQPKDESKEILPGISKANIRNVRAILDRLIYQIKEIVDIREELGIDEKDRVPQKYIIVHIIDKLLKTAKENKWQLSTKDGFIYIYNGCFHQPIEPNDFRDFLGKVALKMLGSDSLDARYYEFKDKLYKQYLSNSNMVTKESSPDKTLINVNNFTLHITNKGVEPMEFNANDFLKYQLSFNYTPDAAAPLFTKYLNRVLPDQESQNLLAESVAYVFTNLKLEKVTILYGSGSNGKSVFFDIINALLGGENITTFSMRSLMKENARSFLVNSLLNYASEINNNDINHDVFKTLASGEPITAKLLYKDVKMIKRYAKLMFNANTLPSQIERTEAYFRRFNIIPFTQTISEEEKDINLAKKIIDRELSGVLNWVIDGLNRLLQNQKFSKCLASELALSEYKKNSNSVHLFIEELDINPGSNWKKQAYLYDSYKTYCIDNGMRAISNRKFGPAMERLGFTSEKKSIGKVIYVEKKV